MPGKYLEGWKAAHRREVFFIDLCGTAASLAAAATKFKEVFLDSDLVSRREDAVNRACPESAPASRWSNYYVLRALYVPTAHDMQGGRAIQAGQSNLPPLGCHKPLASTQRGRAHAIKRVPVSTKCVDTAVPKGTAGKPPLRWPTSAGTRTLQVQNSRCRFSMGPLCPLWGKRTCVPFLQGRRKPPPWAPANV